MCYYSHRLLIHSYLSIIGTINKIYKLYLFIILRSTYQLFLLIFHIFVFYFLIVGDLMMTDVTYGRNSSCIKLHTHLRIFQKYIFLNIINIYCINNYCYKIGQIVIFVEIVVICSDEVKYTRY